MNKVCCVTSTQPLNGCVRRIHTDAGIIMDIHTPSFDCADGDMIKIQFSSNSIENSTYLVCGHVYQSNDKYSCLSVSGLLICVPHQFSLQSRVYVNVSKANKKGKRTPETHVQSVTRRRRN